jgi:hypothetical protein
MDYPLALSAHAQKGTTVMDYTINKLGGYGSAITVPIGDAYKDAPEATKLGRAAIVARLQWADLQGADLRGADLQGADLRGAYLRWADLRGADLRGAYLRGADLLGADLRGAYLRGAPTNDTSPTASDICELVAGRVTRSDGYEFALFKMQEGPEIIRAGCRTFSIAEFRNHVASKYPGTPKAEETLRILDYLEASLTAPRW